MLLDGNVTSGRAWSVVIPVKSLSTAKTRLDPTARESADLALAFFQDTVGAVRACPAVGEVLVATTDPQIVEHARSSGCIVVSDDGHPGINAAARHAAEQRVGGSGVAVIVSDLPCLTAESLSAVLAAAGGHVISFLADADGDGTTMWFSTDSGPIDPRFGVGSRAAHVAAGAADLVEIEPALGVDVVPARRDVDTRVTLDQARGLGLGPHTLAILGAIPGEPADRSVVTVAGVAGHGVRVVDEDGVVSVLPHELVAAAGLRDLHRGQRLAVHLSPDGVAVAISLP